jgi:hypothetical protein
MVSTSEYDNATLLIVMRIKVEKNPELEACTITHMGVRLETSQDVIEWRTQLMAAMEAAVGSSRLYLLVDFTGFWVKPDLANEYGRVAEELRRRFAKEVFRYGMADPLSFASARSYAMKRAHSANVFKSRVEAIDALNRLRNVK